MGARKKSRRKKPQPSGRPRKKQPVKKPAPPRKKQPVPPRKRKRKRVRAAPGGTPRSSERRKRKPTRDWRSSPTTRRSIVGALKKIAGSLVERLIRAPLDADETSYLRGIANLKMGKRPTPAQAIALLAASRASSWLSQTVYGKRERSLVTAFLEKMDARALTRTQTPSSIIKYLADIPPGLAMQLAHAHATSKDIFYREHKSGAIQRWSVNGFRRFISNPIYKTRRSKVFKGGKFWMARSVVDTQGRSMSPKKGRTTLKVQ